jgi:NADPH2:quinone reductase
MTEPGGPDVLALRELPDPRVTRDDELLVRLMAAGVNPVDTKLRRRGTYFPDRPSPVLGCDGAGIVAAVGPAVRAFKPGDEVYFCNGGIGGHPGNYADFATVREHFVAAKPAGLGFIEAAAAPLVAITAWESLHDRARLVEGQRVLIQAGAGGVGHMAVQLARIAGARVAATVGSGDKAELVTRLGAELPILYRERDFVAAVLEWTDGEGVDIVLDTVGGEVFAAGFRATRVYGDVVTLLQPASDTDWRPARTRNLRIALELMLTPMAEGLEDAQSHQAHILRRCAELFDAGELQVVVHRVFPLEQAARAHRLVEAGGSTGKVVLVMD